MPNFVLKYTQLNESIIKICSTNFGFDFIQKLLYNILLSWPIIILFLLLNRELYDVSYKAPSYKLILFFELLVSTGINNMGFYIITTVSTE